MRIVHVNASKDYNVLIGQGLMDRCGSLIREAISARKIAVVAGSNVFPLYAQRVSDSLTAAGFEVVSLQIPAGEEHKTLETFSTIVNFFAENQLSRKDAALALGGGVTGDLTGFAASTYRRGINYIQMPTTLLSSVDSSVGGKTAVDLPAGKNLCGAFWQPSLVIFDPETLKTLPEQALYAGYAEIIKTGMILDGDFFHLLETLSPLDEIESTVEHCVQIKRDVVAKDEFDLGLRGLLNFGHTFGHSVEKLSLFSLPHGYAVAIGMVIVTRAAVKKGLCNSNVLDSLISQLRAYHLPTTTAFSAEEIYESALSDKKISNGSCDLIVPRSIGFCEIRKVPSSELKEWITLGLEE